MTTINNITEQKVTVIDPESKLGFVDSNNNGKFDAGSETFKCGQKTITAAESISFLKSLGMKEAAIGSKVAAGTLSQLMKSFYMKEAQGMTDSYAMVVDVNDIPEEGITEGSSLHTFLKLYSHFKVMLTYPGSSDFFGCPKAASVSLSDPLYLVNLPGPFSQTEVIISPPVKEQPNTHVSLIYGYTEHMLPGGINTFVTKSSKGKIPILNFYYGHHVTQQQVTAFHNGETEVMPYQPSYGGGGPRGF